MTAGDTVAATSRMSTRTNTATTSAPTSTREPVKRSTDVPVEIASSTSSTRRPATSAPRTGGSSISLPRYPGLRTNANGSSAFSDIDAASGTPAVSAPTTTSTSDARRTARPRPEIAQQLGIGVSALHRECVDRRTGVIPAAGPGPDQPRSRREASGEQFIHPRVGCGFAELWPGRIGLSKEFCGKPVFEVHQSSSPSWCW